MFIRCLVCLSKGELDEQFVGGRPKMRSAQRLDVLIKTEQPAGPVAGFQQPVGEEEQPSPVRTEYVDRCGSG
jgi:hypothetical protein